MTWRPLLRSLVVVVVALAACGESATEPPSQLRLANLGGTWEGLLAPYVEPPGNGPGFIGTLVLDVEMSPTGVLTGTARIRRGLDFGPVLDLRGNYVPPVVQMRIVGAESDTLIVAGESDDFGGVIDAAYLFDTEAARELGTGAGVVRLLRRGVVR